MRRLSAGVDPEPGLPGRRRGTLAGAVVSRAAGPVGEAVRIVRSEDVPIGIGPEPVGPAAADAVETCPRGVEQQRGAAAGRGRGAAPAGGVAPRVHGLHDRGAVARAGPGAVGDGVAGTHGVHGHGRRIGSGVAAAADAGVTAAPGAVDRHVPGTGAGGAQGAAVRARGHGEEGDQGNCEAEAAHRDGSFDARV